MLFVLQESFAGIYMCNANNMVKENGNVHATKEINIEIVGT